MHTESSHLAGIELMALAISRGENIVHPTVGRDAEELMQTVRELREAGYEVHLAINEIPPLEAARRAYRRFLRTGRYVDFHYILSLVGDRPSQVFQQIKNLPEITSYQRFSNDVPFGQPPLLLEEGGTLSRRGLRGDRARRGAPRDQEGDRTPHRTGRERAEGEGRGVSSRRTRALSAGRGENTLDSLLERWRPKFEKLYVSERGGTIRLELMTRPAEERGSGVGSRFLEELVAYADATGQRIALDPDPSLL